MCCRYGYEPGLLEDMGVIPGNISKAAKDIQACDVHPCDQAVVVLAADDKPDLRADVMRWGFFLKDKKLLINARRESASEKKIFSESLRYRRCVIPAAHFYEWDRNNVKNTFFLPDRQAVYMAGFYNMFENSDRFVILTTEANRSMAEVHDRMPLILDRTHAVCWIWDDSGTEKLLKEKQPDLERVPEYEQLSFFSKEGLFGE